MGGIVAMVDDLFIDEQLNDSEVVLYANLRA
jgi:hypothetical protein